MTLRSKVRQLRETMSPTLRAVSGKVCGILAGASPVARSCQIPDLRRMYRELGLKPRLGFFVEVGAFDGEQFSNTSFLADQGWRGIYVEPVPEHCRRVRRRHFLNRVEVAPVAVSDHAGELEFNLMGPLTTFSTETVDVLKSVSWAKDGAALSQPIRVPCDTLQAVLERHAAPHDFELMVVDVEGGEEPVVDGLLASPWRPRVLIIELSDDHPDFVGLPAVQQSHRAVRKALTGAGYSEFYRDEINTIFVQTPAPTVR